MPLLIANEGPTGNPPNKHNYAITPDVKSIIFSQDMHFAAGWPVQQEGANFLR